MASIFITGSGRRLGRGLALLFASKGWNIGLHYNTSKEQAEKTFNEVRTHGVEASLVQGDVRNVDEMSEAIAKTVEKLGIPDALVNNSGILPERASLQELDLEVWNKTIDTNMTGMLNVSKIYAQIAPKGAHIVNIASLGGLEVWKQRIPYNVSKAGAIHLSKALARELAPDIIVNCVAPGMIHIPEEAPDTDSYISLNKIPMGRYGEVNDIFEAVYFFATCPAFITGQLLAVDGGQTLT